MSDLREECGVVGIWNDPEAAKLTYLGLYALQHRGQEGCGIVTFDETEQGRVTHAHKGFGLVADTFDQRAIDGLTGNHAVGHVRYSTQGGRRLENVQPFCLRISHFGPLAIAHNGNLTNARVLRKSLEDAGSIFTSTSDTEVIVHLIARSKGQTLKDRILEAITQLKGAYSLIIMSSDGLFALRDPFGFRPLVYGERGDAKIVASETCALDLVEARNVREIDPGELLMINSSGSRSEYPFGKTRSRHAFCAFEPIYFARPDSIIFGREVYSVRKRMGAVLAEEAPADADLVIAVPDSGVPMALGFAERARLPIELGLVRNHYVGRTFIEPSQEIRDFGVKLKLNPVGESLRNKRVIVVDDSIVRGTTSVKIIRMLRKAGASEVHMRIGSPPITHSCFYGVDTPSRSQLLAAQKNIDEICKFLDADSIAFLSLDGLAKTLGEYERKNYCFACFNGDYQEEVFADIPDQPTDITGPGLSASRFS